MSEVLIFPLKNERGFKVDCMDNYQHMIHTIVSHHVRLQTEYPENRVMVVYTLPEA